MKHLDQEKKKAYIEIHFFIEREREREREREQLAKQNGSCLINRFFYIHGF